MNEILFKIISRENPLIIIRGYVDMNECSDYCLNFYDQFNDICFRIPLNPYNYYCDEYYDYVDLVYAFETDERFMHILKKFAKCDHQKVTILRPHYDLVMEKNFKGVDLNE